MSATEYDVNLRDIFFVLFEQLNAKEVCEFDKYKEFAEEDFKMILEEATKFAKEVVAPANRPGDEEGAQFIDGKVKVPEAYQDVYKQYCEAGWIGMAGSPDYGGQGLPKTITMSASEIFTGANCSFSLYNMLTTGAAHIIEHWCDEKTKQLYLPKMYSGQWSGTMVLTEPHAGSDLGIIKSTAKPVEGEDYYLIEGSKIFISAGDQDLTENIVHLVLAKLPDAPPGTKGISLFLVPKYRVNEDGSLGEFNDVNCVRIEHKHGINGSATAQLSFGDNGDCRGWLIGEPHTGMKIMFEMMNEARIEVGVQGATHAAAAYLYARDYAKERLQGAKLSERKNPEAPRVPIIEHPDVRRMLLHMKVYAEGLRALLYSAAKYADYALNHPDEKVRELNQDKLDLLTPICKAYGSEMGLEIVNLGMQVMGGVGYTKDYPMEQLLRDTRIATIYEGTNGIQALDLFGRKLQMKRGALFQEYMEELGELINKLREDETLGGYAKTLDEMRGELTATTMQLGAAAMQGNLEGAATWAVPYLRSFGDIVMGYQLLWQADIAKTKLEERLKAAGIDPNDKEAVEAHIAESEESKFYAGKLDNIRYFYSVILPETKARLQAISKADTVAMDAHF